MGIWMWKWTWINGYEWLKPPPKRTVSSISKIRVSSFSPTKNIQHWIALANHTTQGKSDGAYIFPFRHLRQHSGVKNSERLEKPGDHWFPGTSTIQIVYTSRDLYSRPPFERNASLVGGPQTTNTPSQAAIWRKSLTQYCFGRHWRHITEGNWTRHCPPFGSCERPGSPRAGKLHRKTAQTVRIIGFSPVYSLIFVVDGVK